MPAPEFGSCGCQTKDECHENEVSGYILDLRLGYHRIMTSMEAAQVCASEEMTGGLSAAGIHLRQQKTKPMKTWDAMVLIEHKVRTFMKGVAVRFPELNIQFQFDEDRMRCFLIMSPVKNMTAIERVCFTAADLSHAALVNLFCQKALDIIEKQKFIQRQDHLGLPHGKLTCRERNERNMELYRANRQNEVDSRQALS